jgi:hypothetical protein
MTIFHKLFLVLFAFITAHLNNAHAEVIEVTLHDVQIQQFFAQKGFNFNQDYLDLVFGKYNSQGGRTVLILKIKEIFKKNELDYSVNFPESHEALRNILHNKFGIPELLDHENNNKNEKYFNNQLIRNTAYSKSFGCTRINGGIDLSTLNLKNLSKAIGSALCSYLLGPTNVIQRSIPLYVKIFIDTKLNNITVLAAPKESSPQGFTCLYTEEDVQRWFVFSPEIQKFGEEVQAYIANNIHQVSIQSIQNFLHPTSSS